MLSRSRHQLHAVVGEGIADVNLLHGLHRGDEVVDRAHRLPLEHVEFAPHDGPLLEPPDAEPGIAAEHLALLVGRGVVEPVAEHEPIELGLGEFERAALLDRILRGDYEERGGQDVGLGADRDLPLLHGLEQRALHLWRCAVDLVGKQQVGEGWTFYDAKLARLRIEHF